MQTGVDVKTKKLIAISLVIALLCLLYFQTFIWLVNSWLSHSYYSHGFLVPLVSGFITWRKRHLLKQATPFPPGILVIALGLLLYVFGLVYYFNFLLAISFLVVLVGLTLYFWGKKGLQSFLFPICFLIFMIPLPFLDGIGTWLQSLSANWSSAIIGAMGIPVTLTGAEIRLEESTFTIGIPCSGMNTLIALLALATIFGYFLKGHFYKKAVLFIMAIPIAILANLFRIVSTLVIANHYGTGVAMTFFHTYSSILFFVVAILCLVVSSWLLRLRLRGTS
jgi:exosortase